MRRILSSWFRTNSLVLLDKRRNVLHKGAAHRVQCVICKVLSSNLSFCIQGVQKNRRFSNATVSYLPMMVQQSAGVITQCTHCSQYVSNWMFSSLLFFPQRRKKTKFFSCENFPIPLQILHSFVTKHGCYSWYHLIESCSREFSIR